MVKVNSYKCDNPGCGRITERKADWVRISCTPYTGRGIAEMERVVIRLPGENTPHAVSPRGGFIFCTFTCMLAFMKGLCQKGAAISGEVKTAISGEAKTAGT